MSSDEKDKTRNATGVKFSSFTPVQAVEGNPIEVVGLRDGDNVRASLTTDLVETNPNAFRDKRGRFTPAPEELAELTNQRSVNEFLWKYTQEGSDGHEELKESHDNLQEIVENGLGLQASIENAVDLLNDKVTSLEGAVGEHSLIFTGTQDNPEAGHFTLKNQAYQIVSYISEAQYIVLSDTDRNDKPINLERIQVGDVLRMSDISRETAELKVTAVADNNYTFENIGGELDRLSELPYDFVLLSSFDPAGLATIDYVDERDKTKLSRSGGKMDGLIDMADQPIVNLPEPSGSKCPATKKYVDDKLKDATTTTTLWKYCEGKSKHELGAYEFTVIFPGGHGIEVILYPYIKGRWWAPASTTNYSHGIGEQYVTITDPGGACAIGFKAWKWWFIQKGKNAAGNDKYHNALEGDYYKHGYPEANRLKDQHYYNLNFPPPFPLVMFPESMHTSGQGAFGAEEELEGISPDAPDMGEVMP